MASKKIWRQRWSWVGDPGKQPGIERGENFCTETDWVSGQVRDGLLCHIEESGLLLKGEWRSPNASGKREMIRLGSNGCFSCLVVGK